MTVKLKVKRLENICFFELEWGNNQQLTSDLAYPPALSDCYQEWQQIYLNFYKSATRGRVAGKGRISSPSKDWRSLLVQAEAKLLQEFHHWLRSAELFEIRAQIVKIAAQTSEGIDLFLACNVLELERLPWETWEIAAESPQSPSIRLLRLPASVRQNVVVPRREKCRILVILGDDTGLDFQGDRAAIEALKPLAEIESIGWQPNQDKEILKQQICDAIADKQGWDILLFAGHSNETTLTGGEFAIAPQTFLSLSELKPYLLKAKEKGLQFALFNSCSGLSIASALIDLGLSQVVIMREPIHNDVARVFLQKFLSEFASFKDVQACTIAASQCLQTEANLTYPSAYLIPSLFRHPGSQLFCLAPPKHRLKHRFKPLKPHPLEAIILGAIATLSLLLPIQDSLIAQRILLQARYRHLTQQIPAESAPVLLISIDEESIRKEGIVDPNPIDRKYLARIINQLTDAGARSIGIDYLLDRSHAKHAPQADAILRETIARSPQTLFTFAAMYDDVSGWLSVHPDIAQTHEVLQGQIHVIQWHVWQLSDESPQVWKWPFSYLVALSYVLQQNPETAVHLTGKTNALTQIEQAISAQFERDATTVLSPRMRQQPLTVFSYNLKQMWLEPIIDFSIPPHQIYEEIPAWQLLEEQPLNRVSQQAVIIASGGYSEAGVTGESNDRFPIHPAVSYWFKQEAIAAVPQKLTGGQVHAYLLHHYLRDRLVIPIPDIWAIAIAFILAKTLLCSIDTTQLTTFHRYRLAYLLGCGILLYGAISLQVYISAAIVLPWLLPSLAFSVAIFPSIRNQGTSH
jgi:hypothetical protein